MKTIKILLGLSFVMLCCSCASPKEKEPIDQIEEPVIKEESVQSSITLSFVGDMTLGNYAGQTMDGSFDAEYQAQSKNSDYFLKNVKSIFDKDDLTVANLEGPLTNATSHAEKQFAFKGKPEYVNILKNGGVDIVTLANNHSQDYFTTGMNDTKATLDKNNIDYFGLGKVTKVEVKDKTFGFLSYSFASNYSFPDTLRQQVETDVKALKKDVDIVVVYYHWGIERETSPLKTQRTLGQQTIDYGADLVIGSHPHVLQGIETYKGKKIVYSLSNFCFGGNKNPGDKDSMIYQYTFNFDGDTLTSTSDKIIPVLISSSTTRNNYQPTLASGKDKERILKKVNEVK
ncbi:MAG: CapA family protein [Coprobacillus sp.]